MRLTNPITLKTCYMNEESSSSSSDDDGDNDNLSMYTCYTSIITGFDRSQRFFSLVALGSRLNWADKTFEFSLFPSFEMYILRQQWMLCMLFSSLHLFARRKR